MRNTRSGFILLSVVILPLALLGSSCSRSRSPQGVFPYDVGVIDPRDAPASLEPLRGRPAVFVTYAASMPDCRKRIGQFVTLSEAFRDAEVRFVAVDISPTEAGKFPEALPDNRGQVLFLKDRNNEVSRAMKIDITPTTFFVSVDGKIQDRIESVSTWDSPDFRRRVDMLAGNR